jgi:hypothetical protein
MKGELMKEVVPDAITRLYEKYPDLFEKECASEIPEAWYELAEKLCARLQEVPGLKIVQMKSKFGGFRCYWEKPEWTKEEWTEIEGWIEETYQAIKLLPRC